MQLLLMGGFLSQIYIRSSTVFLVKAFKGFLMGWVSGKCHALHFRNCFLQLPLATIIFCLR